MDTRQIKILLEKYYEGRSTLEEEQALRDNFLKEVTDPELLPLQKQFLLLQAGRELVPPENPDFEVRLAQMIDTRLEVPVKRIRSVSFLRLAIAASILLMIGISGLLVIQNKWNHNRDTFEDPQKAYAEAQRTLLYVGQKMNSGIRPLSSVSKINAGNEQLKNLKKLNSSLEMLNIVSFINNSSNLKK
jgi:hypothetical protein